MSNSNQDKLSVHVNIEVTAAALKAIVANAKKKATKDPNGTYRIDTADQVSIMVSRSTPTPKPAAGGMPCSRART